MIIITKKLNWNIYSGEDDENGGGSMAATAAAVIFCEFNRSRLYVIGTALIYI